MPPESYEEAIVAYLRDLAELGPEPARSERFALLLNSLFSQAPQRLAEYLRGRERDVVIREGARLYRGRVDCLSGNTVIEFERSLAGGGTPGEGARGRLAEAQEQLRRYVSALWSEEGAGDRRPYLAMATDGQLFAVYTPVARDPGGSVIEPGDVRLEPLTREMIDLSRMAPAEAFTWLDRYLFHKERRRPTTEEIVADFGLDSHAFATTVAGLRFLWERISQLPEFAVLFESWDNYLRVAYGESFADAAAGLELFLRHTYLATLAKLMVW
ncbi:MAG: hypothetical protein H5T86_11380, partial [Armatimonadetes bacterium]|nr:hypothetical protein [Armatimonadota bacterium]